MKARGGSFVVRALEDEGVRFTFGIPGTHNIELYDALDRSSTVTPVLVTDEQSASFMADGVSRSSEQIGVANLVPGAGVTHALSGIAEAFMDTVPLVVLVCGIRNDTGKAYQLHDIDQLALLRPVTKATFTVTQPNEIYATVRRAFALARSGAPGPVAVEVPANYYLLAQDFDAPRFDATRPFGSPLDPRAVETAAAMLGEARFPALYVGLGARAAGRRLTSLAERIGAPVTTTISGKGVFPESHPLFLWNGFGSAAPPFVRAIMARCDCLLAVGCRFGEVATGSYGIDPPPNLIHVDADERVFHRNVATKLTARADAGEFLDALLAAIGPRSGDDTLRNEIAAGHRGVRESWRHQSAKGTVAPASLFAALQRACGDDAIYVTDSGNGTFLAMEHLRLDAPGRFLAPVDFSCMGYGVPAAIGAKLANPERDVVALAGDGALLMTGLELLTAAAYKAGVLVCVLRDGELAQIAQFQRTTLNRATCAVLAPYSVEEFARAAGCRYVRLANDADLASGLDQALALTRASIPVIAEVVIDYSQKTFFTKGVITTNFWRLGWSDRMRLLGRAVARRIRPGGGSPPERPLS